MPYSRANPSERYQALLGLYRTMHSEGSLLDKRPAHRVFPGQSLLPQAARIKTLIQRAGAETILDYGCGKGLQYELRTFSVEGVKHPGSIVDYWDVVGVHCYDPCCEPHASLPEGQFDGVISTDVLEHCPEEDLPWVLGEIFSYARSFVFASIACFAARSRLPNGENAHCTIRPAAWWDATFREAAARHPALRWEAWVLSRDGRGDLADQRLANFAPEQ